MVVTMVLSSIEAMMVDGKYRKTTNRLIDTENSVFLTGQLGTGIRCCQRPSLSYIKQASRYPH
jgi:hypothetical protein